MTKNVLNKLGFLGAVLVAAVGFPLIFASSASAQLPAPAVPANPAAPAPSAEVERVIVTGSNIPTAEETGPNPVDTYRPQDIEKLGIRNATDLTTFIPQEAGGTVNQNIANGGDGTRATEPAGPAAKETLILIDGKRIAQGCIVRWLRHPADSLLNDRSHRYPQGRRLGCVRSRRSSRCGQLLPDPQIPWLGDWWHIRKHKPGSLQRHG